MRKYNYSKELLENLVKNSSSYSEIARKLGMNSKGGNYNTLRRNIQKLEINTEHFTGRGWSKGKTLQHSRVQIEEYLSNSKTITSWKLKNKLIDTGLKENKCEICGISEWNGSPISCQLHHINGNNMDNSLSNLQMLCPNCHSQTDNYAGRNLCKDKVKKEKNKKSGHPNLKNRKVKRPSYEQFKKEFTELKNNYSAMARKYDVSDNAIRKWIKSYEKYGV